MKISYLLALPLALAAPIIAPTEDAEIIPGRFIVVMKPETSNMLLQTTIASVTGLVGSAPSARYNMGTFKGFAVSASDSLIQTIADIGAVSFVEPDTVVRTSALVTQQDAPYGLARISHRSKTATGYTYDDSAGQGTYVYGIDTGVYCGHNDFAGRCTFGANYADKNNTDGNGHGTHTAATAAGTRYGVAKKAQVIAVKVLDASGSGATSQVISGIQFAADDMVSKNAVGKAVANLSLGGPRIGEATNQAAAAAVEKGLFLAVAAGNNMQPTVLASPASEPTVCTVAASDKNDQFASFSNFGGLVDVIAPGVAVLSAWINGPDDTNTISGTSMASPHVAGLGAYLLALEGSRNPAQLCDRIKALSTKGAISGLQTLGGVVTKNQLAFNGATA